MLYTFGGKAPQVDPTAFVSASAELIGDVIVGPRCYIGPFAVIRADASRIVLEEEVAVEDGVIIHTGGEDPVVTISRRVTIGHGAIIHARAIGPEASIGMGAASWPSRPSCRRARSSRRRRSSQACLQSRCAS